MAKPDCFASTGFVIMASIHRIFGVLATWGKLGASVTDEKPGVLLVEDDDAMREYLSRAIRSFGYAVYTAGDGVEGLAVFNAARDNIHVVVSDVVMPRMDGIEFCQTVSMSAEHIIEFMFITGFAAVTLRAKADAPGTKILSKPFHLRDFAEEVDLAVIRVLKKRRKLLDRNTAGLHAKLDDLIALVERRIQRDQDGRIRAETKTLVFGAGNTVNVATEIQTAEILHGLRPGDFATLQSALDRIGISAQHISDLKQAVDEDGEGHDEDQLGPKTQTWLKRTLRSVSKGTTKVAGDVASAMLTKIISAYFGLPD